MTRPPVPVYAGIVVSDVTASVAWYEQSLACSIREQGPGWTCLAFPDNTIIELFAGDPTRAGETFPSYGGEQAPPVMPGYALEDPDLVLDGLQVARSLPDWHVVVAPDGLRVVLTVRDTDDLRGLAGFRFASPASDAQQRFLDRLGLPGHVAFGQVPTVVPVVGADRDASLVDPDGTPLELVGS